MSRRSKSAKRSKKADKSSTFSYRHWNTRDDVNFNPQALFGVNVYDEEFVRVIERPEWLVHINTPELLILWLEENPLEIKRVRFKLATRGMLEVLQNSRIPWKNEDLEKYLESAK